MFSLKEQQVRDIKGIFDSQKLRSLSGYKSERIFAPDFCILVPEIVARRKHFDYAIGLDGSNYQMFLLVRVL